MHDKLDFSDLKKVIEINSWSKNKAGVDTVGNTMIPWFEELGFTLTRHERESIGDHLHFTTEYHAESPRVLLLGHIDTVFPPGKFEGFSQDEEWIYGPGTCDMKGGNFVALEALRAIHKKYSKVHNIDVLLVSDEETGSDDSKHLTASLASQYDVCLDFEAAGENHEVVTGRKGVATYTFDLKGRAAHAGNSYLLGRNANLAAARLLLALTELTDLDKGTTVNVGKIEGGIGANTISPHAQLMVEARFKDTTEKERVLSSIEAMANKEWVTDVTIELSGGLQRHVMMPSQAQEVLLDTFKGILGYALPTEQRGGVSDANVMAGEGVTTLDGFGPFGDGDHTIHERAKISSFVRRIEETTKILDHFQN
ncbi:M20 family metallopeptidase [Vibrio sp.]|nr:M20 family metallopeptidase [Vibrio sp.]